ncbi:hypothetical protein EDB80DRAFT_48537 [Ilyonectria destructans]|nr:hypothetical protein EDB80DRAFT_48537 [Ilyonectria destructans]
MSLFPPSGCCSRWPALSRSLTPGLGQSWTVFPFRRAHLPHTFLFAAGSPHSTYVVGMCVQCSLRTGRSGQWPIHKVQSGYMKEKKRRFACDHQAPIPIRSPELVAVVSHLPELIKRGSSQPIVLHRPPMAPPRVSLGRNELLRRCSPPPLPSPPPRT